MNTMLIMLLMILIYLQKGVKKFAYSLGRMVKEVAKKMLPDKCKFSCKVLEINLDINRAIAAGEYLTQES